MVDAERRKEDVMRVRIWQRKVDPLIARYGKK
jgi:hypothetical protein